jgi:hypothetical protein
MTRERRLLEAVAKQAGKTPAKYIADELGAGLEIFGHVRRAMPLKEQRDFGKLMTQVYAHRAALTASELAEVKRAISGIRQRRERR